MLAWRSAAISTWTVFSVRRIGRRCTRRLLLHERQHLLVCLRVTLITIFCFVPSLGLKAGVFAKAFYHCHYRRTEDSISLWRSSNVTVRRGLIDGNNSPTGVGVMFEQDDRSKHGGVRASTTQFCISQLALVHIMRDPEEKPPALHGMSGVTIQNRVISTVAWISALPRC
eukprot:COSAG02_NODE_1526_length_12092_cov_10.672392_6_plen_170_part_00